MKKEALEIVIRESCVDDAKTLLNFYQEVGAQTPYLSFGKEGLNISIQSEKEYLQQIEGSKNNHLLLAFNQDELIGVASVGASQAKRIRHIGEIGIVVKQAYWGLGLSRILMSDLLDWCYDSPILTYVRLEVAESNGRGIHFYQKFPFTELARLPLGLNTGEAMETTILYGLDVSNRDDS